MPCVQDDHACLAGLAALWDKAHTEIPLKVKIIRVGVALLDLSPAGMRQLDLFADDDHERQKCEVVMNTMDYFNRKFGKRVVTLGSLRDLDDAIIIEVTCIRCLFTWLQSPLQLLIKVDRRDVRMDEVAKNLACPKRNCRHVGPQLMLIKNEDTSGFVGGMP